MNNNNERLADMLEILREKRLGDGKYIERLGKYQKGGLCQNLFIQACEDQRNLIQIQFRNEILYMSIMFFEGVNENGDAGMLSDDEKICLFSSVDALYVSLIMYRISFCSKNLLNEKILGEKYDRTLNKNNDIVRGTIAGVADYLVTAAMQNLQDLFKDDIFKNNDKDKIHELYRIHDEILKWYGVSIEQICREYECIISSVDKNAIFQRLNEIWKDTRYVSLFSLGRICAGGEVEQNDNVFKEFEFRRICRWIIDNIDVDFPVLFNLTGKSLDEYIKKTKKKGFKHIELLKFCDSNL